MIIFIIVILYCIIISILFKRRVNCPKYKKRYLYLFFAPLLLIQTFKKTDSLPDLSVYVEAFQRAGTMSFSSLYKSNFDVEYSMEPGYIILNKLIYCFSGNEHFLYFSVGLVIVLCYITTLRKYCPYVVIGCFLYLFGPFSQSLFVLRQHLSIAIVLLSFPFVINRQFFKFCLIMAISISIHYTSAVFLPVYFLYQVKDKKIIITCLIAGSIALKLMMIVILNYAISLYGSYAVYLDADGANYKVPLLLFGLVLIRILYTQDDFLKDGINRLITTLLFVGFSATFAGIGFGPSGRLFMVYSSLIWVIAPQTINLLKNRRLRSVVAVMYIIASVFMFRYGLQYVESLKMAF